MSYAAGPRHRPSQSGRAADPARGSRPSLIKPKSDAIPTWRQIHTGLGEIYANQRRLVSPDSLSEINARPPQADMTASRDWRPRTGSGRAQPTPVEVPRLGVPVPRADERAVRETMSFLSASESDADVTPTEVQRSVARPRGVRRRPIRRATPATGVGRGFTPKAPVMAAAAAVAPAVPAKSTRLQQAAGTLGGVAAVGLFLVPLGWWRRDRLMASAVRRHHVVSWSVLVALACASFGLSLIHGPIWLAGLLGIVLVDALARGWLVFRRAHHCGLLRRGLALGVGFIAVGFVGHRLYGVSFVVPAVSAGLLGAFLVAVILLPFPWQLATWLETWAHHRRQKSSTAIQRITRISRIDRLFGPDLVEIAVRHLVGKRLRFNACYRCGYSLRGHTDGCGRCPECGSAYVREAMAYRGGPYGVVDWRGRLRSDRRASFEWESAAARSAITVVGPAVRPVRSPSRTGGDRRVYAVKVFPVSRS